MAGIPTFLRFLPRTRRQAVGTAGIRHSCQILTRLMITVRFPQICAGLLSERESHSWHLRQFIRPPRSRCKESNLEQIHLQMGGNNEGEVSPFGTILSCASPRHRWQRLAQKLSVSERS